MFGKDTLGRWRDAARSYIIDAGVFLGHHTSCAVSQCSACICMKLVNALQISCGNRNVAVWWVMPW